MRKRLIKLMLVAVTLFGFGLLSAEAMPRHAGDGSKAMVAKQYKAEKKHSGKHQPAKKHHTKKLKKHKK